VNTELIAELRQCAAESHYCDTDHQMMLQAAEEIERLGKAISDCSSEWTATADALPPECVLLIGYWYHEPIPSLSGHHTVVPALKDASYQVCYFGSGYFWAFYCGSYDAQLVPATKWRVLSPLPEAPK
jgi:hypothetical protein